MAKTKEELNKLKKEYEALNKKLNELENDELMQITGGSFAFVFPVPDSEFDSPKIDNNTNGGDTSGKNGFIPIP